MCLTLYFYQIAFLWSIQGFVNQLKSALPLLSRSTSRGAECAWKTFRVGGLSVQAALDSPLAFTEIDFILPGLSGTASVPAPPSWGQYSQQDVWLIQPMSGHRWELRNETEVSIRPLSISGPLFSYWSRFRTSLTRLTVSWSHTPKLMHIFYCAQIHITWNLPFQPFEGYSSVALCSHCCATTTPMRLQNLISPKWNSPTH